MQCKESATLGRNYIGNAIFLYRQQRLHLDPLDFALSPLVMKRYLCRHATHAFLHVLQLQSLLTECFIRAASERSDPVKSVTRHDRFPICYSIAEPFLHFLKRFSHGLLLFENSIDQVLHVQKLLQLVETWNRKR